MNLHFFKRQWLKSLWHRERVTLPQKQTTKQHRPSPLDSQFLKVLKVHSVPVCFYLNENSYSYRCGLYKRRHSCTVFASDLYSQCPWEQRGARGYLSHVPGWEKCNIPVMLPGLLVNAMCCHLYRRTPRYKLESVNLVPLHTYYGFYPFFLLGEKIVRKKKDSERQCPLSKAWWIEIDAAIQKSEMGITGGFYSSLVHPL